jgi:hypothetical protein
MKTLIKKEIRLLPPAWIVAMLLAVISPWILPSPYGGQSPLNPLFHFIFPLGVLFLGITSFGMEFNSGTFGISLSQPMDRRTIWKVKTTTLFIAFLGVWSAAVISFLCRLYVSGVFELSDWQNFKFYSLEILTLSALVAFSGGLWTTLLLQQMTGAFWVTLLTPLALLVGIEILLGTWIASDWILNMVLIAVLTAYSVAGFSLARWLFFHAQDTRWTDGNISFAWHAGAESRTARPARRSGHWASALVLKEFHLHQVNILIAGILLVFQLSCLAALKIYPHFRADVRFALESVCVIWFLMPLLIGSSAIAEERRLGVLETQLCLPASRTTQWFAKFSIALLLSLLFGGIVPFAVTRIGVADSSLHVPAAVFIIYPLVFSFVSTYASSLVRSTLLAIGTAMAIAALLWAASAAIVTWNFGHLFLKDYPSYQTVGILLIVLFLGLPLLLVVLAGLTFWNFKWSHEQPKLWWRNIISVLVAVLSVCVLANAIYFRAWEPLTAIQPAPGPARLDSATILKGRSPNAFFTILPDGRIWSDTVAYHDVSNQLWQTTVLVPENNGARFIGGSNWVDVAADRLQAVGIQSDGTLWSMQRKWNPSHNWRGQSDPLTLAQIGSDTDWVQVAADQNGFMLLKRDESLWRWGTHDFDFEHQQTSIPEKFKLDRAMIPFRISAETDWLDLFSSHNVAYAKRRDGSLWRWAQPWDTNSESSLVPVSEVNTNGPWSSIAFLENGTFAGIKTNGELWLYSSESGLGSARSKKSNVVKTRLGGNAKWKICGTESWNGIWAIRDDGTLWKWPPLWAISDNFESDAVQLGTRSDWLSLSDAWLCGVGLAADGSVWAWDQPSRHIWLAPSRKPVYMGNIFEGR